LGIRIVGPKLSGIWIDISLSAVIIKFCPIRITPIIRLDYSTVLSSVAIYKLISKTITL
jgi:hypothetical protein